MHVSLNRIRNFTANDIVSRLKSHWDDEYNDTSRLPGLAIHAAYKCLVKKAAKYRHCRIKTPEKNIFGDIEILDKDENDFEVVKIDHEKPINFAMLKDMNDIFKTCQAKTFVILRCHEKLEQNELPEINKEILDYYKKYNIHVIINNVITSLKYYIRLIKNNDIFIDEYLDMIEKNDDISDDLLISWSENSFDKNT